MKIWGRSVHPKLSIVAPAFAVEHTAIAFKLNWKVFFMYDTKSFESIIITILFLLVAGCGQSSLNHPKGHLIIIGGGDYPDSIMDKFLELAGGSEARILIIPNASSEPVETGKYYKKQFENYDIASVDYLAPTRETVDTEESLAKLDDKTGVFFSGGDQSRLTDLMSGTQLLAKLRQMYRDGIVIGGTSAGAAIQSEIMITGNELLSTDSSYAFSRIQAGNIEYVPGFSLVDEAIIDQHHIRRKRHNRLISLVL